MQGKKLVDTNRSYITLKKKKKFMDHNNVYYIHNTKHELNDKQAMKIFTTKS